ncbi:GcvT family protein [Siccirubricoccus phaeus]|uniref:GcvT family protein n=1 Tax=Siccirubricoccus phaeus TaxID=2595053 RepID=UPI0011F225D9|nr:FAD-dependent oxidoreductase [Siccirubricoccus phaeus]
MPALPDRAQVVIIGGGVVGCSLAYHLVKRGWRDVLLLERKRLTSGTTWHAAGLVGQLRATQNLTRLAQYTTSLYRGLEAETGQPTGFRRCGSLAIATTEGRMEELARGAAMASCFGLEAQMLGAAEAAARWPHMYAGDVLGGVFLPEDGYTSPIDTTQALAKGARQGGARILEGVRVTRILHANGAVTGVETDQGVVQAEYVVNCAGLWARDLAAQCGVAVPLHAAEHFYVVTEPIPGLPHDLPVLRDPDARTYIKPEQGKLLIGWFEEVAKPWGMEGVPDDFEFGHLPDDFDHIAPLLELAQKRIPALGEAGIRLFFNGPESFTPDDRYLLGEAPELKRAFVAAGFNSIGIQSAGGAGKVLADWIVDGHPPMDLWDVDIRRVMPFQRNRRYLHDRTVETLGLLYDMHWPFRQPASARGVRRTPLHDAMAKAGACFGETAGWERANWFAPPGMAPRYEYSYGRQNWFAASAAEHRAVREAVGLFDLSSFAKFVVEGSDAEAVLNRICANDVAVPPGRVVYTQWLNERGGIEADVTVTRESAERYLVVTAAASQTRDLAWLRRNIPEDVRCAVFDATSGLATIAVMGPHSRALLSRLTDADLSNAAFPFATSQVIDLAYARLRATRITYVGELGWELYMPSEFAAGVHEALVAEGAAFGLRHAGYHALNSLRIEKAYRHWGHDIGEEDTPLEAGLGFAVAWSKPGGFIGRQALLPKRGQPLTKRLVVVVVEDPEPLLTHNEPIFRDGTLVGRTTSAMFGHTIGRSIALGYVEYAAGVTPDWLAGGRFEIQVGMRRVAATASLKPPYDPAGARIKA